MKRVTLQNYKKDKYYPRIVRAVTAILESGDVVTPVDVFMGMGLLAKQDLEAWWMGRVPYLEKVIHCNLEKASRVLRILKLHAESSKMKPSQTDYRKWGKGRKIKLRFSKYSVPAIEEAYSRHFICPRRKKRSSEEVGVPEGPQEAEELRRIEREVQEELRSAAKLTLEVPTEVINAIRLPPGDLERELLKELALALYNRGVLSLGKAQLLAQMARWQFEELLGERQIPRHYTEADLEEDLRYAQGAAPQSLWRNNQDELDLPAQRAGRAVCRACSTAWGCKSPAQPDGGEVLAKRKGK